MKTPVFSDAGRFLTDRVTGIVTDRAVLTGTQGRTEWPTERLGGIQTAMEMLDWIVSAATLTGDGEVLAGCWYVAGILLESLQIQGVTRLAGWSRAISPASNTPKEDPRDRQENQMRCDPDANLLGESLRS